MLTAVLVTPRTIVELWQFSTVTALKQGRKAIKSKIIESQSLVLENYTLLKKALARNQTMRYRNIHMKYRVVSEKIKRFYVS